ncbi:hypothetical protein GCM10017559_49330 [Streptosporangium longisporum]|uniref:Uncharacterized protein n=1 Tax=Streptosporangium longisporum TaxID=46187 RepID=A0ABN3Y589_9ACTN
MFDGGGIADTIEEAGSVTVPVLAIATAALLLPSQVGAKFVPANEGIGVTTSVRTIVGTVNTTAR